jgi:hypothetical protein
MLQSEYMKAANAALPFLDAAIAAGDETGAKSIHDNLRTRFPEFHNFEVTSFIKGGGMELTGTKLGSELTAADPSLKPEATYEVKSLLGAGGNRRITSITELEPEAPKLPYDIGERVKYTGDKGQKVEGTFVALDKQGEPVFTDVVDIAEKDVGKGPSGGRAIEKWDKDAAGRLDKMFGKQTELGFVIDPDRMEEYQLANTYLGDYRDKGLTPSDAAVLAATRAEEIREPDEMDPETGTLIRAGRVIKPSGVDPIQIVIDQQRAAGVSDEEIIKLLKSSKYSAINPRTYGLKSGKSL